jgi:hypothetical protein
MAWYLIKSRENFTLLQSVNRSYYLPDMTPCSLLERIHADLILGLLFDPEDGSSALLGNFGKRQPHYVAPRPTI